MRVTLRLTRPTAAAALLAAACVPPRSTRRPTAPYAAPYAVPSAPIAVPVRSTPPATVRPGDGWTVVPYGRGPATLACSVLRACLVQLPAGEILDTPPIVGDTVRWRVRPVHAGDGRTAPLVVVTPTDCDLTTNLVLATDTRLYQVLLDAPACNARAANYNPRGLVTHVAFSVPDSLAAPTPAPVLVNRHYAVHADKAIAWRPTMIYDDGHVTTVVLPPAAHREALPLLYVREVDGTRTLVNFRALDGTYRVDRVFREAVFVVRRGRRTHELRIVNQGATRAGGAS